MASVSTLPPVVDWIIYFLLRNVNVQTKIFQEAQPILDKYKRCDVRWEDEGEGVGSYPFDRFEELHFTRAAIAEAMRCSNMFNVLTMHLTTQVTRICQYDVPANTPCIANIQHINNCSAEFEQPEVYRPERFLDSKTGKFVKPKNFFFFGTGGNAYFFGDIVVKELMCFVARVVSRYEISVPEGYKMPSPHPLGSGGNFVCNDYKICVRRRC